MEAQAREMLALGARNVLIKGGHGEGAESVDLLIGAAARCVRLAAKRLADEKRTAPAARLSSAIAAGLAKGRDLVSGDASRQSLRHRGDRRRRPTQGRPRSTGRCIISSRAMAWIPRVTGFRKRSCAKKGESHDDTTPLHVCAGASAAGLLAAPSIARAQTVKWRMVTSWPKRLPGPGMSAERVAERIRTLSGGRIDIAVYAAGEVVPAFEVLGAVGNGVADIGHTASFYWQGKMPAAAFFTTVPFGLTPAEHVAWIEAGGGQALWDELYAPFGVKPFMGGNTGVCMGGWFRRETQEPGRSARAEVALARPGRRGLSPARRHAADHAAGGNPG